MTPDKIFVVFFGITAIGFTYWFFFMKKDEIVDVEESIDSAGSLQVDILVDGGYSPNTISIPKGKTTRINFLRKDPNSCLEEVVLSEFKIRKSLPLNRTVTIEVTPEKEGVYDFVCGMNMFHGRIIIR